MINRILHSCMYIKATQEKLDYLHKKSAEYFEVCKLAL